LLPAAFYYDEVVQVTLTGICAALMVISINA
jgi:hypothetical protein